MALANGAFRKDKNVKLSFRKQLKTTQKLPGLVKHDQASKKTTPL